jgi:hypothetical protein
LLLNFTRKKSSKKGLVKRGTKTGMVMLLWTHPPLGAMSQRNLNAEVVIKSEVVQITSAAYQDFEDN